MRLERNSLHGGIHTKDIPNELNAVLSSCLSIEPLPSKSYFLEQRNKVGDVFESVSSPDEPEAFFPFGNVSPKSPEFLEINRR